MLFNFIAYTINIDQLSFARAAVSWLYLPFYPYVIAIAVLLQQLFCKIIITVSFNNNLLTRNINQKNKKFCFVNKMLCFTADIYDIW